MMTRMLVTAGAPGTSRSTTIGTEYRPGVCNIGPEEIAMRRRAGHVGLVATAVLLLVLVAVAAPPLARLALILPAGASASGYLQAWLKFCAGFGSRGVFNFGPRGHVREVDDPIARAQDRRRALQIALASLAVGIVVAVVAIVPPLQL